LLFLLSDKKKHYYWRNQISAYVYQIFM